MSGKVAKYIVRALTLTNEMDITCYPVLDEDRNEIAYERSDMDWAAFCIVEDCLRKHGKDTDIVLVSPGDSMLHIYPEGHGFSERGLTQEEINEFHSKIDLCRRRKMAEAL